jgi:hypothetical protein
LIIEGLEVDDPNLEVTPHNNSPHLSTLPISVQFEPIFETHLNTFLERASPCIFSQTPSKRVGMLHFFNVPGTRKICEENLFFENEQFCYKKVEGGVP